MTELVCVAPDGSLEVWRRGHYRGLHDTVSKIFLLETIVDDEEVTIYTPRGDEKLLIEPEFWGRVVLGEL